MTPDDYDRLNWHQRQAFNDRLRAETATLKTELAAARAATTRTQVRDLDAAWVRRVHADATQQLAELNRKKTNR